MRLNHARKVTLLTQVLPFGQLLKKFYCNIFILYNVILQPREHTLAPGFVWAKVFIPNLEAAAGA